MFDTQSGINSKKGTEGNIFKLINSIYWGTFNNYTQQGNKRRWGENHISKENSVCF